MNEIIDKDILKHEQNCYLCESETNNERMKDQLISPCKCDI